MKHYVVTDGVGHIYSTVIADFALAKFHLIREEGFIAKLKEVGDKNYINSLSFGRYLK